VIKAIDKNLADWLPPLSGSDQPAGLLRLSLAQKFGFPDDVIVSAGGGDNMMGAIGTGNVSPGVVSASLGTSGTIYAYANKPVVDPNGEIAAFCSSTGGWLPLLCTMNVTLVTEQFRGLFNWDHSQLEQAVASTPAGSGGLSLLPYFDGERTPNLPRGTGVLAGLNRATLNPAHLARAAMEGVTMNMNYGLRRLTALGIKPREIRVTGGGSRSAAWRQMMADIFGVPVVAMIEDEGAALGGALQAAWCEALSQGRKAKLTDFTTGIVALNETTRCVPDAKRKALYRKLQDQHEAFSQSMRPVFG
jgi:xylulokinase